MALKTAAATTPHRIPHAAPIATPLATFRVSAGPVAHRAGRRATSTSARRARSRSAFATAPVDLPIDVAPPEGRAQEIPHRYALLGRQPVEARDYVRDGAVTERPQRADVERTLRVVRQPRRIDHPVEVRARDEGGWSDRVHGEGNGDGRDRQRHDRRTPCGRAPRSTLKIASAPARNAIAANA